MDRMGLILLVENLDQYEAAVKAVKNANDQVATSTEAVEAKSKSADKSIGALATAFAAGNIAAQVAMKAITAITGSFKQLIVESTMAAARYRVLDAALDVSGKQAGYTKEELDKLQLTMVEKGLTYQTATSLALQLLDAEVGLDKALELVTTAQNAASRAGADTSVTVERLIQAMQTGQPELLRSVFLTANFVKAEEELAKSLNTTRDALTPAQQMQARMNAIIAAGVPLLGTYDAAMEEGLKALGSLQRATINIKTLLGKVTEPAWTAVIQEAYKNAQAFWKYLEDHKDELEEWGARLAEGVKLALGAIDELLEVLGKVPGAVKDVGVELAALSISEEEATKRATKLGEYFSQALSLIAAEVAYNVSMFKSLAAAIGETIGMALPLGNTIELLTGQMSMKEWAEESSKNIAKVKEAWDYSEAAAEAQKAYDDTIIKVGELTGAIDTLHEKEKEGPAGSKRPPAPPEATKEQIKAAEALIGLQLDLQREYANDLIEQQRETLEQEIDLGHEREDMARENAKAIADAYVDSEKDRVELIVDGNKKMDELNADATQKGTEMEAEAFEKRENLDRDYADRKVDIERDTVRRLKQIRQEFEVSVQDAARTRDAFALVQAQRRAAQETQTALESREQQLGDARVDKQRRAEDDERDLAKQRVEYTADLEERRLELAQSLHEDQVAIEDQLQEKLISIEQSRQDELANRDLQLQREREMQALQTQWEQEDRTLKLQRQIEDMQQQYGTLGDVTAQGLQQQVQEWANTYGPEGAATKITTEFKDMVTKQTEEIQAAMAETLSTIKEISVAMSTAEWKKQEVEFQYKAPPELQLHSPKLGLQLGMEKLQEMMKSQPMPFMAGGFPAVGGTTSRTETYNRSEARHDVNINAPSNLDLVVQRALVGTLKSALKGVAA